MNNKIRIRTFWLVVAMLAITSALAYVQDWSPLYVLTAWVVLLSARFGGAVWAKFLEVVKAWVNKGGGP